MAVLFSKIGAGLIFVAFVLGTTSSPSIAAQVGYRFGGTLDQPFAALPAGTSFSGTIRYDTNAAPIHSYPASPPYVSQNYYFDAFTVNIDGQTISATPGDDYRNNMSFSTEGNNSHRVIFIASEYNIGTPDIVATGPVGGADVQFISILLDDASKTALTGTAPAASLALADFATYRLFDIGSVGNQYFARGTLTYLRPVPLPAASALFLSAIMSLGLVRLFGKRENG
jgi:hypothetical protein